MIPRILTGVALTGMLAAAGCGGGSGAGSPLSAAPAIGGAVPAIGGAPAAKARGSFVASFTIPYSAARASAASSRSPQYLSPGTTGLTVLVGNGDTVNAGGVTSGGTTATSAITSPAAGAGTITEGTGTYAVGDTLTVAGITLGTSGAAASTPDVFTVTGVSLPTVNGTWAATGFGTAAIGAGVAITTPSTVAQTAVIGSTTAALALSPGTTTQSIPLSVNGATATSSLTYSFAPAATAGYYTFSAAFSGFTPNTTETIGVVTTDIAHNNFVLSEGQGTVTVPAVSQGAPVGLTLNPVVDNIFVPTPTVITIASIPGYVSGAPDVGIENAANGASSPLPQGALETTIFATDEMGYVIPSGAGGVDNLAAFTIVAATSTDLTLIKYLITSNSATFTGPAVTNTSLTALPATAKATGVSTPTTGLVVGHGGETRYTSVTGTFLTNILTPSPYSLATNGGTINPYTGSVGGSVTNSAGNPLAIECTTSSSSVAWNAVLTSTTPVTATVTGYPITAGTNYPAAGNTTIPLTPINCTPGFTVPIN